MLVVVVMVTGENADTQVYTESYHQYHAHPAQPHFDVLQLAIDLAYSLEAEAQQERYDHHR